MRHNLGAIAYSAVRRDDEALAAMLKGAACAAAAGSMAQLDVLDRIERRFAAASIPVVLLKGAALAQTAYREPALRTMSDLDLWVSFSDIPRASSELEAIGFDREAGLADRPDALQRASSGEIGFCLGSRRHIRVELHYGVFQGWWARRTARPDIEEMWLRATPLAPGRHARVLAPADAILQSTFHNAVNQLGQAPVRGLLDIAVLSRAVEVDWDSVAARAEAWRLSTVTWLVLEAADALIGLRGAGPILARLRPAVPRRTLLRTLSTPMAIVRGADLTRSVKRHLFMLALTDRAPDAARLLARAVWPESWWMEARYGRPVGRVEHVLGLIRRRAV